jgi:hypothetical protein
MPDGALPGQYGGHNSPVRQACVVEPNQWGLAAIWTRDGYICPDGYDGHYRLIYNNVPPTGFVYGYDGLCGAWVPVLTRWQADCLYAPVTTVPFTEAPADGNLYARDGLTQTWVQINPNQVGTGIPDAPMDGFLYGRQMGQWVQISTETFIGNLNAGTY